MNIGHLDASKLLSSDSERDVLIAYLNAVSNYMHGLFSDATLTRNEAFQKLYGSIKAVIDTMMVGADSVSAAVQELPNTVKDETNSLCEAFKKAGEVTWNDLQKGDPALMDTVKHSYSDILAAVSKLLKTIAPLIGDGAGVLTKGATDLSAEAKKLDAKK